ncbi:uncharacterized protein BROUX77_006900 [Berkeleyomyces rouxiae]|uniref:uncharacterized protein n=1 Tax=Berkeleyomyces rouxiae TaxID=2035830 RepID=UPI003B823A47
MRRPNRAAASTVVSSKRAQRHVAASGGREAGETCYGAGLDGTGNESDESDRSENSDGGTSTGSTADPSVRVTMLMQQLGVMRNQLDKRRAMQRKAHGKTIAALRGRIIHGLRVETSKTGDATKA